MKTLKLKFTKIVFFCLGSGFNQHGTEALSQSQPVHTDSGSLQSFFKNGTTTLSCHFNTGNSTGSKVSSRPITITEESFNNAQSTGGSNPVQYSFWNTKTKQIEQVQMFQVYKPPTICSGKFSAKVASFSEMLEFDWLKTNSRYRGTFE